MQISFINKKLAKLLNSKKEVIKKYGPVNGKIILRQLSDMVAAGTLEVLAKLPQKRIHELTGNRDEQISVDVKHPYRLILQPDYKEAPRKEDGGLDWSRITKVVVKEITDTHKK